MDEHSILYTAKELNAVERQHIQQEFTRILKREVRFEYKTDESLLGGFLAMIDGMAYDNSLKTRLKNMRTHILNEGEVHINENAKQIGEYIQQRIETFTAQPLVYTDGVVESSGDSIAQIRGLERTQYGEIIEFENGVFGMAMDLDVKGVGVVLLNGVDDVSVGSHAKGTGTVVEVPVGDELLGRVIDPLGRPLDGEPLNAKEYSPIEKEAPTIMERQAVNESLQTGLLVVDSMIPIGKGQRELIIGDRQTGKTAIAVDAMLNQKGKNVICVYVAIGQKASTTALVVDTLKKHGAMDYSIVLASPASDCPAMQYIAPYAGCSIAEHFMHSNRNALIIFDDLSKHAVAYRTMSLLLKRPPGREAYPGDVFYLHSRLLERSARLSKELGGGSITALPIVETMAGDISAYIPTNVISITDGQIYLESDLFHSGVRPAVNVGLSVSRVGGSAQHKAMRKVSGKLRLALAQYRELAIFTQFGADIDPSTKRTLDNGVRLTEAIKQKQYSPLSLSQQVMILLAYNNGMFRSIPISKVQDSIAKMLESLATTCRAQIMDIERSGDLSEETEKFILQSMEAFMRDYKEDMGLNDDV